MARRGTKHRTLGAGAALVLLTPLGLAACGGGSGTTVAPAGAATC